MLFISDRVFSLHSHCDLFITILVLYRPCILCWAYVNCSETNYMLNVFIKRLWRILTSIFDHLLGAQAVSLTHHISVCRWCIVNCVKIIIINNLSYDRSKASSKTIPRASSFKWEWTSPVSKHLAYMVFQFLERDYPGKVIMW